MKIVPVLDLLGRVVVRGIAGRRAEYRPLRTNLFPSPVPVQVARQFRGLFDVRELYVADLDAILHDQPNWLVYRELIADGFSLWIDAGVRSLEKLHRLQNEGVHRILIGLETCPSAEFINEIAQHFSQPENCTSSGWMVSLDLMNGQPMTTIPAWRGLSPLEVAADLIDRGVTDLLILDLSDVGGSSGCSTLPLIRELRSRFPALTVHAGGGIRTLKAIRELEELGVESVLLASALHDGRLFR